MSPASRRRRRCALTGDEINDLLLGQQGIDDLQEGVTFGDFEGGDEADVLRNSGQSSLGRDSIARPSTPAPPLNFSGGGVLMGTLRR